MLDRIHSPAFLIEHSIVDDTANRQLAVRLDWIVLEILITAVAVDEEPPVRMAAPNFAQQGEIHRRALDVERFVVFDHRYGAERIDGAGRHVDDLAKHLEVRTREKIVRLPRIVASAVDRERERLEPRRRLAVIEQQAVEAEQHRAAVDPTRKGHTDRRRVFLHGQPRTELGVECFDVMAADQVEIGWQHAARRIEETLVNRIRIGTADELQRGDVVRWNHARIARMKLVRPPAMLELSLDLVDSLGDDQHRTGGRFGEEVSQRPVEASGEHDALAVLRDERERAVEREDVAGLSGANALARRGFTHRPEALRSWWDEVDDFCNRVAHDDRFFVVFEVFAVCEARFALVLAGSVRAYACARRAQLASAGASDSTLRGRSTYSFIGRPGIGAKSFAPGRASASARSSGDRRNIMRF